MESILNTLKQYHVPSILYAGLLLIFGYFIARFMSLLVTNRAKTRLTPHSAMLMSRAIFYIVFALFLVSAIQQLGFHLGALLGAAGILTAAIGFASQTSMSNVISGLFIIGEKPFEIGDTIKVNDVQGVVVSIDWLSVKIRTSDNTMVRVPNEVLIKSAIANLSFFPNRRADLKMNLSYQEDIAKVRKILLAVAEKNKLCLNDPAPALQIQSFGDSSVELQFSVWATQANFSEMKNQIQEAIQIELLEKQIDLTQPSGFILKSNNQ